MNDDDLLTTVRDRFGPVRMDTPAKEIIARGTALRRRRNGGRLAAGALAISLGAGLSVPALTAAPALTAGTTTVSGQQAALAAWTVQTHSDGSIGVTIRRPENLSALQKRLAALGAPLVIDFGKAQPAHACAVRPLNVKFPNVKILHLKFSALKLSPLPRPVFFKLEPGKLPPHALLWIHTLPASAKKLTAAEAAAMKAAMSVKFFAICGQPLAGQVQVPVAGVAVPAKSLPQATVVTPGR